VINCIKVNLYWFEICRLRSIRSFISAASPVLLLFVSTLFYWTVEFWRVGNDAPLSDMRMPFINGFKRRVLNRWAGKKVWVVTRYKEFSNLSSTKKKRRLGWSQTTEYRRNYSAERASKFCHRRLWHWPRSTVGSDWQSSPGRHHWGSEVATDWATRAGRGSECGYVGRISVHWCKRHELLYPTSRSEKVAYFIKCRAEVLGWFKSPKAQPSIVALLDALNCILRMR